MLEFDAWEDELFDRYNGEGRMTQEEFEANEYDKLGGWDSAEDGDCVWDPFLKPKSY